MWVVTGDGDALSIGGNHLIHALRRNVNLKILLFNNQIYGLTKGQYSPTSELGKVTKSTPMGSLDYPFNPLSIAIGAEASFVARAIDTDKKGLTEVLGAAARHRGSAFVEILQNCNIYNDGAFDYVRDEKDNRIYLESGAPIRFGAEGEKGVVQDADGSAAGRRRGGGGRGLAPRARRGPARAEPRVRALADHVRDGRRRAARRLPAGRAAGLRRPHERAARRGAREARARATSRRSSTPATPGPSARSRPAAARGPGGTNGSPLTGLGEEADDPLRDLLALLLLEEVARAFDDLGRAGAGDA